MFQCGKKDENFEIVFFFVLSASCNTTLSGYDLGILKRDSLKSVHFCIVFDDVVFENKCHHNSTISWLSPLWLGCGRPFEQVIAIEYVFLRISVKSGMEYAEKICYQNVIKISAYPRYIGTSIQWSIGRWRWIFVEVRKVCFWTRSVFLQSKNGFQWVSLNIINMTPIIIRHDNSCKHVAFFF